MKLPQITSHVTYRYYIKLNDFEIYSNVFFFALLCSCSTCSISGDCTGPSECCLYDFYQSAVVSDVDISCRSNGPPCVVPIPNDPCGSSESNPCQNGAPCGISFQYYGLYEEGSFTGDEMCINEVIATIS